MPPTLTGDGHLRLDITRDAVHSYSAEFRFGINSTAVLFAAFALGTGAIRKVQLQVASTNSNSQINLGAGGVFRVQVKR